MATKVWLTREEMAVSPDLMRRAQRSSSALLKRLAESGDEDAKAELAEAIEAKAQVFGAIRGLVASVCRGAARNPADFDDCMSFAWIAVENGFRKHDPDRGVKWSGYARRWAVSGMLLWLESLRCEYAGMHIPTRSHREARRRAKIAAKSGENVLEVMVRGLSPRTATFIESAHRALTRSRQDQGYATVADHRDDAGELLDRREEYERLIDALSQLDARSQWVIGQRYLAMDTLTLKEVGMMLGITKEAARQIEVRAIRKLRTLLT